MDGSADDEGPADLKVRLEDYITYRITRVHAALNAQASAILRDGAGLTLAQYRILALVANQGPASSADLTRGTIFDKGQFSRKLKTLVDQDLIRTTPDKSDQRVQILSLTDEGRRVYGIVAPLMARRQKYLRSVLGEERIEELFAQIELLSDAAKRMDF